VRRLRDEEVDVRLVRAVGLQLRLRGLLAQRPGASGGEPLAGVA
jgi:hypothetical protein